MSSLLRLIVPGCAALMMSCTVPPYYESEQLNPVPPGKKGGVALIAVEHDNDENQKGDALARECAVQLKTVLQQNGWKKVVIKKDEERLFTQYDYNILLYNYKLGYKAPWIDQMKNTYVAYVFGQFKGSGNTLDSYEALEAKGTCDAATFAQKLTADLDAARKKGPYAPIKPL